MIVSQRERDLQYVFSTGGEENLVVFPTLRFRLHQYSVCTGWMVKRAIDCDNRRIPIGFRTASPRVTNA